MGYYERVQYSKYQNFRDRINYAMQSSAISIKAETPENPSAWSGSTVYNVGAFVVPTTVNGYAYKATTYGITAAGEPSWPTTLTNTVVDGGITWECVNAPTPHHSDRSNFADKVIANGHNQNSISLAITTNSTIGTEVDSVMAAPAWEADTAYILDDDVTPVIVNGFRYVCTSAGTTGSVEPTWPMIIGNTVNDGGVEWTCDGPTDNDIQYTVNSMWNTFSGVESS
jgi:hypothetical protein